MSDGQHDLDKLNRMLRNKKPSAPEEDAFHMRARQVTPTDIEKLKELATKAGVQDLARRLRGQYRIPITDGLGAAGGEEPDNPNEFVRTFQTPPIQKDAAALLEHLFAALEAAQEQRDQWKSNAVTLDDTLKEFRRDLGEAEAALEAKDAEIERLKALVSSSEAERYAKCGELLVRAEAAEAALKGWKAWARGELTVGEAMKATDALLSKQDSGKAQP